jgi:hypothetical protein
MQNEKASSRRSVNPSLHGHTHYFPFSALHFICSHSERASVRKEPFSDQLGLGLKIFLDRSSNGEYTKDESTKPEIRLIPNVIRSCRRLPSPELAIF